VFTSILVRTERGCRGGLVEIYDPAGNAWKRFQVAAKLASPRSANPKMTGRSDCRVSKHNPAFHGTEPANPFAKLYPEAGASRGSGCSVSNNLILPVAIVVVLLEPFDNRIFLALRVA